MKYNTITKYLLPEAQKRDPTWFFKRATYAVTGWLTKQNKWIQAAHYHCHPQCIHKMEPEIEPVYSESIDVQFLAFENQKNLDSEARQKLFRSQQLKEYKCIERGNVRVLEVKSTISFTANSLERLNKALKVIQKMFWDRIENKQFAPSDILNADGTIQSTAEYDAE